MRYGVYKITNIVNGKIYIGSSSHNIYYRKGVHFRKLSNNNHENEYLQRSFNKHGIDSFTFDIIELCDKVQCIEKEQYWLDYYKSYDRDVGYNINQKANSRLNSILSEETKEKIRKKAIGRKASEDTKKKLSLAGKSRTFSKETLDKIIKIRSKPVLQYDLEGNFIREWKSATDAEKLFGSGIQQCCYRKGNYCKGFVFRYK